jgi:hypothetical protein
LEFVVRQCFERLLASLLVNEALPLQVEQCENVGNFFLAEDAGFEA